jgi:hypothetical protein
VKDATALMKPTDEEILGRWPVSKRVNSFASVDDDRAGLENPNRTISGVSA